MIVREAGPGEREAIRTLLTTAYGQYAAAVPVAALFDRYLADVTDVDREADRCVTLIATTNATTDAATSTATAAWTNIKTGAEPGASTDSTTAGTARYYPPGAVPFLPADWAWVRAVGVAPHLRRAGVARQLMAECLRRATDDEATALSLHTMAFMPDAVRLYERLGYRRAPELDIDLAAYYRIDGEMVALAYRLDLAS
jgi:GNAT superfamily N-acetyltransferase